MKPFNLEAAKAGEPLVTRLGTKAEFIAYAENAREYWKVVTLIDGEISCFNDNGKYVPECESSDDLFMAPKTRTVWVNFFPQGEAFYHDTEEAAIQGRKNFYDEDVAMGSKPNPVEIEE